MSKRSAIRFASDAKPEYTIKHREFVIDAAVPPPEIEEIKLGSLTFAESLAETSLSIGGVKGTASREAALQSGVRVIRERFVSEDGGLAAVRVVVENAGKHPFHLLNVVPLLATGNDSMSIGGAQMADWRVLRASRQKNDIPGVFRPSVDDDNLADAMFSSTDVTAGAGVALHGGYKTVGFIAGDPSMVFRNDKDESHPPVFMGVFGQIEHLSEIRLYPTSDNKAMAALKVLCEFDGVLVEPGESRATHWVLIYTATDEYKAMQQFADMLAVEHNLPEPPPASSSYCNWYFYGLTMNEKDLEEELENLKKNPVPFRVFVLDNGWMDNFGVWSANERFPSGMRHAADMISAAGYVPGLWTAPFIIMADSPILKEHPDLLARDQDGEPVKFGYQGPLCYVMDPTSPYAAEYFKEFFGRLRAWGFPYHKFDFLRAIPNGKGIRFYNPKMTRAQVYRMGMQFIRDGLGPDAYILACGGLYESGVGLVDGQRSGCDVVASWQFQNYKEDRKTAQASAKQNIFRSYMNRLWHTDPDAAMIRLRTEDKVFRDVKKHLWFGDYTDEEAFTNLIVQYIGGGNVTIAERFPDLQDERRAMFRYLFPVVGSIAVPLDIGAPNCPSLFFTSIKSPAKAMKDWWTLTVVNWNKETVTRDVKIPADRLPKSVKKLAVFEFKTQEFVGLFSPGDTIRVELPVHGSRVFRLAIWKGDKPIIAGTDQNLAGGWELRDVKISAAKISGKRVGETQYDAKITVAVPHKDGCRVVTGKVAAGVESFEIPLGIA